MSHPLVPQLTFDYYLKDPPKWFPSKLKSKGLPSQIQLLEKEEIFYRENIGVPMTTLLLLVAEYLKLIEEQSSSFKSLFINQGEVTTWKTGTTAGASVHTLSAPSGDVHFVEAEIRRFLFGYLMFYSSALDRLAYELVEFYSEKPPNMLYWGTHKKSKDENLRNALEKAEAPQELDDILGEDQRWDRLLRARFYRNQIHKGFIEIDLSSGVGVMMPNLKMEDSRYVLDPTGFYEFSFRQAFIDLIDHVECCYQCMVSGRTKIAK